MTDEGQLKRQRISKQGEIIRKKIGDRILIQDALISLRNFHVCAIERLPELYKNYLQSKEFKKMAKNPLSPISILRQFKKVLPNSVIEADPKIDSDINKGVRECHCLYHLMTEPYRESTDKDARLSLSFNGFYAGGIGVIPIMSHRDSCSTPFIEGKVNYLRTEELRIPLDLPLFLTKDFFSGDSQFELKVEKNSFEDAFINIPVKINALEKSIERLKFVKDAINSYDRIAKENDLILLTRIPGYNSSKEYKYSLSLHGKNLETGLSLAVKLKDEDSIRRLSKGIKELTDVIEKESLKRYNSLFTFKNAIEESDPNKIKNAANLFKKYHQMMKDYISSEAPFF